MRPVTVQFLKYPDLLHWGFETYYLGEDEFGWWMAVPIGTKRWKGLDQVGPSRFDAVFCAPSDGWWHLHYSGPGVGEYSHFVDITTQPVWIGEGRYQMVDLDLDVAMRADGEVIVEDEDEFETHQLVYGYTAEMIKRAREETEVIVAALHRRQEPFFEVADSWLSRITDAFA